MDGASLISIVYAALAVLSLLGHVLGELRPYNLITESFSLNIWELTRRSK